ncbi:hypothetical protein HSACCH_01537 [Halanaerobium saccharolyticum subsp. saccharolyticum DSM 6643]|uniref:Uncharacterized protein n=1 Tax=Halanaerobium saccharolyticum subsp. saccharolyticum DSM 6643 TaxID=1293054 RepID=M5E293_9FIRM|nr:hypothetical protein [Halanaerobium saccharolyticum]CCU79705.1 hypothetical protein HSACCH_01537 [Halanaerobium saccharolyticum subsp. saccharolyticum DSM 6643]
MKSNIKRILFFIAYICVAASLILTKLAANYQGVNRSLVTRSYRLEKTLFSNFNLKLLQILLVLTFIFLVYKLLQTKNLLSYISSFFWNVLLLYLLFKYHQINILGLPYLTLTMFLVFLLHFIYSFRQN